MHCSVCFVCSRVSVFLLHVCAVFVIYCALLYDSFSVVVCVCVCSCLKQVVCSVCDVLCVVVGC